MPTCSRRPLRPEPGPADRSGKCRHPGKFAVPVRRTMTSRHGRGSVEMQRTGVWTSVNVHRCGSPARGGMIWRVRAGAVLALLLPMGVAMTALAAGPGDSGEHRAAAGGPGRPAGGPRVVPPGRHSGFAGGDRGGRPPAVVGLQRPGPAPMRARDQADIPARIASTGAMDGCSAVPGLGGTSCRSFRIPRTGRIRRSRR